MSVLRVTADIAVELCLTWLLSFEIMVSGSVNLFLALY